MYFLLFPNQPGNLPSLASFRNGALTCFAKRQIMDSWEMMAAFRWILDGQTISIQGMCQPWVGNAVNKYYGGGCSFSLPHYPLSSLNTEHNSLFSFQFLFLISCVRRAQWLHSSRGAGASTLFSFTPSISWSPFLSKIIHLPTCCYVSFILLFSYILGFSYERNHMRFKLLCLIYFT